MSPDDYVRGVVAKYTPTPLAAILAAESAKTTVTDLVLRWAFHKLRTVDYSGSFAKGTNIAGGTDLDLFISLAHDLPWALAEIHQRLGDHLRRFGLPVREQNVSLGITLNGLSIDLVPGHRMGPQTEYHSLFHRRTGTWRQTNVAEQIRFVEDHGRQEETRALKIWRKCCGFECPSFLLELAAITALSGRPHGRLGANMVVVLQYLESELRTARLVDPANTNNIVSDDLSDREKAGLASRAGQALRTPWGQVIW
jgi:hypothetical protein